MEDTRDIYNILACEILDKELELPIHFFEALESDESTSSVNIKKQLAELFKDVKFSDCFYEKNIILEGLKLNSLPIDNLKGQESGITLLKNKDDIFFFNLFFSYFNDINLTNASIETNRILEALQGVVKRIEHQIEEGILTQNSSLDEIEKNLEMLGRFYHWQICQEASLRGGIEQSSITPVITSALFMNTFIQRDLEQCNGKCGRINSDNREETLTMCDCGGEIVLAPPLLKIENVSFVYPEKLDQIVISKDEVSPQKIFEFIQNSFVPRRIILLLNQLSELKLNKKISIPSIAHYRIKDTNDIVRVFFEFECKSENEITIFACITDTRYKSSNLISAVSLPVILRDVKNGISGDFNPNKIIQKTELRGWKVTPYVKVRELKTIENLERIFSIFGGVV